MTMIVGLNKEQTSMLKGFGIKPLIAEKIC